MNKKINCSVGILTFNSGKTLKRALESVKDFSDIIISDGGSTDETLNIAKEYGCTIIEQYAKLHPGKDTEHPIEDFSLERNRMLDTAKESWFFWLDSDEYISQKLHDEVCKIVSDESLIDLAYKIPMYLQSPDTKITYKVWKRIYQTRLFNLSSGGKFVKKMHERFKFEREKDATGILEGAWYIPLSKVDFFEYRSAVKQRITIMHEARPPETIVKYLRKAILSPVRNIFVIIFKEIILRVRYSPKELIPLGYVRNRLYSQWVTFLIVSELYFRHKD